MYINYHSKKKEETTLILVNAKGPVALEGFKSRSKRSMKRYFYRKNTTDNIENIKC